MCKKLEKIKGYIEKCIGMQCMVMAKQGRKNILYDNCIISAAYPDIFLVKYKSDKSENEKCITFSYAELLTKKVLISKLTEKSDEKGA